MAANADEIAVLELAPTLEPLMAGVGDVRAALDRLASMRFRNVQLSATQPGLRPRDLDQSARRDLLATLRRKEMALTGIDLWIPPAHFLDPANVDRALTTVAQTIELAGEVGRCPVSLTLPQSPKADSISAEKSNPAKTALPANSVSLVQVIEAIASQADRFGVQVADHSVPPMAHEGIGVGIDPATWLSQGMDPVTALFSHGNDLVSARLCDLLTTGMRGPIGNRHEGRLDVQSYHATLTVIGYRRPVVVDARQWVDPWAGIAQCAAAWASSAAV